MHLKEPYKCINKRISHPVNDKSEKSIEKEIRKLYESIDDTFSNGTITKYLAGSSVISQLFVPLKDESWSILDIMVSSTNHQLNNEYVQRTQFETKKEVTEANGANFSVLWWAKYFGLYARNNGIGKVKNMYFGYKDVVNGKQHHWRDQSCALGVLKIQYFDLERRLQYIDYALLSLLLMASRVTNPDFYLYKDKIDGLGMGDMQCIITSDGHYSRTLSLLTIVGEIFNIFCREPSEWFYYYEIHNMKRNDSL